MTQLTTRQSIRRVGICVLAIALSFLLLSMMPAPTLAQDNDSDEFSRQELELLALSPEARAIANKLQCPVCDGQAITESNATIARQMRVRVQQQVDDGTSEEEILDFFVERFGPEVLREPRPEGIGWGVWLAPPIMALIGLLIVYFGLRSGRRTQSQPQPARPVPPTLSDDDEIVTREIGRITRDTN
ncbi:MAG: cytochrome c-type biogenesis protein CcmH [Dehalococcoidia bacterium]|nr:cytochrome c-type biogenesis protein CcmH [Dehalococcoidia bacterium]